MPLNPRISSWAGRTVWLVGASTGIGRATASRLHGLGARVIVSARNRDALDTRLMWPEPWPSKTGSTASSM